MVSLWTRRPTHSRIGLDWGVCGVRAVQLFPGRERHDVSAVAVSEWREDDRDEGDPPRQLASRLQSCMQRVPFHSRRAVAGLNPPAIAFHTLELPPAALHDPGTDTTEMVRWELGRLINDSLDDVETRHWALPSTHAPAPNAIGVTAQRDRVARTLGACKNAGLRCESIDTGPTALGRFGALLNTWDPDRVWGILDVGHEHAYVVLCVDDVPVLVRRAGSGGCIWTQRIAETLQVSVPAAEVHKRDQGIALTGRGVRAGAAQVPSRELASILLNALRGELKDLATEVKRSYEYVLSCYPSRSAGDLVLVGGGAATRNLPEFLNDALGIPVRRASDYLTGESCRLRYASTSPHRFEVLACAIGLALGT